MILLCMAEIDTPPSCYQGGPWTPLDATVSTSDHHSQATGQGQLTKRWGEGCVWHTSPRCVMPSLPPCWAGALVS